MSRDKRTLPVEVLTNGRADAKAIGNARSANALPSRRPRVRIYHERHLVQQETVVAIAKMASNIYQRAGLLVRIQDAADVSDLEWLQGEYTGPVLDPIPTAALATGITEYASFYSIKTTKEGDVEVDAHPPGWLTQGIAAQGIWAGIHPIRGVATSPVLRPDGTVHDSIGYDRLTGYYYRPLPGFRWEALPKVITAQDANAAAVDLLAVVQDVPFLSSVHKSAWLSGLLTLVARHLIEGPCPLFLAEANVPGAGKGLICILAGIIATGYELAISNLPEDRDEFDKQLTALLLRGIPAVLFDNLTGRIGSGLLDAMLTAPAHTGRVLGMSKMVTLRNTLVYWATGNNLILGGDLPRRVLPIRLESLEENPENRTDFSEANLPAWVQANRGKLLRSALMILAGYLRAGKPPQKIQAWGSYEKWSALVANALVWAGLPDPTTARAVLREEATGEDAGDLAALIAGWQIVDPSGQGVTAAECLRRLKAQLNAGPCREFQDALATIFNLAVGEFPSPSRLSKRLQSFKGRVCGNLRFRGTPRHGGIMVWAVRPTEQPGQQATPPDDQSRQGGGDESATTAGGFGGVGGVGGVVPGRSEIGNEFIEGVNHLLAAAPAWLDKRTTCYLRDAAEAIKNAIDRGNTVAVEDLLDSAHNWLEENDFEQFALDGLFSGRTLGRPETSPPTPPTQPPQEVANSNGIAF